MKRLLFFLWIIFPAFTTFAQEREHASCYSQWARVFEERGADPVSDGWHEGVVLSIRRGQKTSCYIARVNVQKGSVVSIFIKYVSGKNEPYTPRYKYADSMEIKNGISRTLQTEDDELINVMFINHIRPKSGY